MSNLTKFFMLLVIGLILAAGSIWFIGGKKRHFETTAMVNASPNQIFPYLLQSDLKQKWMNGFVEQELVGESTEFEEDARVRIVEQINGQQVELTGEVIRFRPGEIISIKGRHGGMMVTSVSKLEVDDDQTKVSLGRIISFGGVDRMLSVFGDDTNEQEIEANLKSLVQLVEADYPGGAASDLSFSPEGSDPLDESGSDDEQHDNDSESGGAGSEADEQAPEPALSGEGS